jgi:hypothetical protein
MVVQVKEKVLIFDQSFLEPDAVRWVKVLEGLDGLHRSALHLAHEYQPIRPKMDFGSQSLARALGHRRRGTRPLRLEGRSRRFESIYI